MRRRILAVSFLLLICCPFFTSVAQGKDVVTAGGIRYQITGEKAIIIGFEPGAHSACLPAMLQGLPTTTAKDGFLGDIPELILEEGITSLEGYEALKLSRIGRVTLPATLVSLDKEVLEDSWFATNWNWLFPWVEEVILTANLSEASLASFLTSMRFNYDFSSYELWSMSWGESGGYVEENASLADVPFRSLTHIRIAPEHPFLYDIDGVLFRKGTDELVACPPARSGAYYLPEGTKSIGKEAFFWCMMLESVFIPRGVTAIGDSAFSTCAMLRTVQLPVSLREIGVNAFRNCQSLTAIVLPNGVKVGEDAFEYCTGLRAVYAMGAETEIAPSAFRTCSEDLAIYAQKGTGAYRAAQANNLLWAEMDEAPERVYNPAYIQTAMVHAKDPSAELPLYEKTDEASRVLGKQPVGTTAKVLEASGEWVQVEFFEGTGYMPLSSLGMVRQEDIIERILEVDMKYQVMEPKLYTAPSRSAPSIPAEERRYDVVRRYGGWYLLDAGGKACYVPAEDAQPCSMSAVSPGLCVISLEEEEGPFLPLYSQPNPNSRVIGVYYNGTQVDIQMREDTGYGFAENLIDGFYLVRVEGVEGYMENKGLYPVWEQWFYYGF